MICHSLKITKKDLLGKSRKSEIVDARKIFSFITSENYSRDMIGKFLNKDHSTISVSIKQARHHIECDKDFRKRYYLIKKELDFC